MNLSARPKTLLGAVLAGIRWVGDARTSASSVAYSLVSRFGIIGVNVATGIIVARALGPAGRGAAAAITIWPLVVSGLLTLGIPAALRYHVRRQPDIAAELFASSVLIGGVLGIVSVGVGVAAVPHILAQYPPAVVEFAQRMMLFAPLMLLNATLQAFYEAQQDFRRSNAMIYIPPLLTLGGLAMLHAIHAVSPYSVAFVYECPFALMTIGTLVALRQFLRWPRHVAERIRSLLQYGCRAYGIDVLNTLAGQVDQAIVVGLLSVTDFGLYAVAVNGSRVLAVLPGSLNSVLFPKASGLELPEALALVSRSARMVFASTAVAALAFVIALPVLIRVAYGNEYSSVVDVTRWLSVAAVFLATTATFTQGFMATGRPGIATILQCVGVCATVPIMLVLIPKFGLTGAAYAVDISAIARFGLVLLFYPIFLHHPIPRLFLTRRDVAILLGSLRRATA